MSSEIIQAKKPRNVSELLISDSVKQQVALALPNASNAERYCRIALTEVRKTPKLAQSDPMSFMAALMQCAQLDLEPGNSLGHAYLIPFENRSKNRTEVQFIIGYKGMIELALRSGQVVKIMPRNVYRGDEFSYEFGLNEKCVHRPGPSKREEKDITHSYCVAHLANGETQFDVMDREEIEAVRDKSMGYVMAKRYAKNGQINSPWATSFGEMAKKTVIRRLFKFLPISTETQRLVAEADRLDSMDDSRVASSTFVVAEPISRSALLADALGIEGPSSESDDKDAEDVQETVAEAAPAEESTPDPRLAEVQELLDLVVPSDEDQMTYLTDLIGERPDGGLDWFFAAKAKSDAARRGRLLSSAIKTLKARKADILGEAEEDAQ